MKTVTGKIVSRKSIGIEEICAYLSDFSRNDNGTSQAVSAYLRRASSAFNELRRVQSKARSKLEANGDELVADAVDGTGSAIPGKLKKKKGQRKKKAENVPNGSIAVKKDSPVKVKSEVKEKNESRVAEESVAMRISKVPLMKETENSVDLSLVKKGGTESGEKVSGVNGLETADEIKYGEKMRKRKKRENLSDAENLTQSKKKMKRTI